MIEKFGNSIIFLIFLVILVQFGFIAQRVDAGATCPGELYYYVQSNSDNREIYTRLKAPSVNDCVRKCYADDFCFSAIFQPKTAPEEADCLLSYVSGFNCTRKQLTNTYSDNSRTATIECLRCPQNGEFVTPPPFEPNSGTGSGAAGASAAPPNPTEGALSTAPPTVAATSQGTTAGQIIEASPTSVTKPGNEQPIGSTVPSAVPEVRHCQTNLTFVISPAPSTAPSTAKLTLVSTLKACAQECYAHACTQALFRPANFHTSEVDTAATGYPCILSFDAATCDAAQTRVDDSTSTDSVLITCVDCGLAVPVLLPSGNDTTGEGAGTTEATPASTSTESTTTTGVASEATTAGLVTVGPVAATGLPTTPVQPCTGNYTFELIQPDPAQPTTTNFTDHLTVNSARQCAELCYNQQCVMAGYVPPRGNDAGACLLTRQGTAVCDRWGVDRVQEYTGENITQIQCVRCEAAASIEGPPTQLTKEPVTATVEPATTTAPARVCTETVTFEVHHTPDQQPNFSAAAESDSASECARLCYERNCVLAGYSPAQHDLNVTRGSCLFAFGNPTVECGNATRLATVEVIAPVTIACVLCETVAPTTAATPESTTPASSEGTTTSAAATTNATGAEVIEASPISVTKIPEGAPLPGPLPEVRHCLNNLTFASSAVPATLPSTAMSTLVSSAKACALECYAHGCTQAVFRPPNFHVSEIEGTTNAFPCILSFDTVTCDPAQTRIEESTSNDSALITCVDCGLAAPILIPGNQTEVANATESTTASPDNATLIVSGHESCQGELSFEAAFPDSTTVSRYNFNQTQKQVVSSLKDCVNLCYAHRCVVAGYVPPVAGESAACLFALAGDYPCGKNPRVTSGNDSLLTEIGCVQCNPAGASVIEATPGAVTQTPEVVTTTTPEATTTTAAGTTAAAVPVAGEPCAAALTFEVVKVETAVSRLVNYTERFNVTSAAECAQLCFSHHCTVAGYAVSDESGATCELSFTSEPICNVAGKVDSYTDNGPVELHCIQCGGVGHVIEATPAAVTVGTTPEAVATTKATGALPEVRKCVGTLSFSAEPGYNGNLTDVGMITLVTTAKACAQECYAHACTKAIFHPANFHASEVEAAAGAPCLLSFENAEGCDAKRASLVQDTPTADSILLSCVECSLAQPILVVGNETDDSNITAGQVIEATPVSVESTATPVSVQGTPAPVPEVRRCLNNLTFVAESATTANLSEIVKTTLVTSAKACAEECYVHGCTKAIFRPATFHASEIEATTGVPCLLSFEMNEGCDSKQGSRVQDANNADSTLITCVDCSVAQPILIPSNTSEEANATGIIAPSIEGSPATVTVAETTTTPTATEGTTAAPIQTNVTEVRRCLNNLTFVVLPPNARLPTAAKMTLVKTPEACARECYAHACTQAVYRPSTFHVSEVEGASDAVPCLLSFDDAMCQDWQARVSEASPSGSYWITCVDCSLAEPILLPHGTEGENATAVSTPASAIEATPANVTEGPVVVETTTVAASNATTAGGIGDKVRRCLGNVTFVAASPSPTASFVAVASSLVLTPQGCALECYAHGCTQALFRPPTFHASEIEEPTAGIPCQLSFDPVASCAADQPRVSNGNSSESYLITCIDCSNAEPILIPPSAGESGNATVENGTTPALAIEATPESVTKPVVPIEVTAPVTITGRTCPSTITFETAAADPNRQFNYSEALDANSAEECAKLCYSRQCTVAGYNPSLPGVKSMCLLSTSDPLQCGRSPKVSQDNGTASVELHCVQCGGEVSITATESAANVTAAVETTTAAGTTVELPSVRRCDKGLKFAAEESGDAPPSTVSKITLVSSASQCAMECYAHGCTKAYYHPANFHTSEVGSLSSTPIPCYLTFENVDCSNATARVDSYDAAKPTVISCVECEVPVPILLPPSATETTTQAAETTSTTAAPVTEANTTTLSPETSTSVTVTATHGVAFACANDVGFVAEVANGTGPLVGSNITTVAVSAQACAKECYLHGCSYAVYDASEVHTSEFGAAAGAPCYLSFAPSECEGAQTKRVTTYPANDQKARVAITCIICLTESVIEATPTSVTKEPTAIPEGTTIEVLSVIPVGGAKPDNASAGSGAGLATIPPFSRDCDQPVTFKASTLTVLSQDTKRMPPLIVKDAQECALECYKRKCTSAVFDITDTSQISGEPCYLSFDPYDCPVGVEPLTNYTAQTPIQLGCVSCASQTSVTEATTTVAAAAVPVRVGGNETAGPTETAGGAHAGSTQVPCTTSLTFEAVVPEFDLNSTDIYNASDARECASICYTKGCTAAGYVPSNGANTPNICMLSFVAQPACGRESRVSDYNGTRAIELDCIQCATESIGVVEATPGIRLETPETTTLAAVTEQENVTTAGGLIGVLPGGSESTTVHSHVVLTENGAQPAETGNATAHGHEIVIEGADNTTTAAAGVLPGDLESTTVHSHVVLAENGAQPVEAGASGNATAHGHEIVIEGADNATTAAPVTGLVTDSEVIAVTQPFTMEATPAFVTITPSSGEGTTTLSDAGVTSGLVGFNASEVAATVVPVEIFSNATEALVVGTGASAEVTTVAAAFAADGENVTTSSIVGTVPPADNTSVVHAHEIIAGGGSAGLASADNATAQPIVSETATTESMPQPPGFLNASEPAVAAETSTGVTAAAVPVEILSNATEALIVTPSAVAGSGASETGSGSGTPCPGRVTFQVEEADENLRTTFTDEYPIESASECARFCYNTTGCQVAAFVPATDESKQATCLLSKQAGKCSADAIDVAQAYRGYTFVINCIKCSNCNYQLRAPDPTSTPNFETEIDAVSVLDCIQQCSKQNCTSAAYTGRSGKKNCMLSTNTERNCKTTSETRLETIAPVLIDCVECRN